MFERKVADGSILSAKGREKWASVLRVHLVPAFGDFYVDKDHHRRRRGMEGARRAGT